MTVALPGISVRPMGAAPRQIPFYAGATYFELDRNSPHWQQMQSSGGFAIHVSGDFPELKMELWAIRGSGGAKRCQATTLLEPDDSDKRRSFGRCPADGAPGAPAAGAPPSQPAPPPVVVSGPEEVERVGSRRCWPPRRPCCNCCHGCATPCRSRTPALWERAVTEVRRFEQVPRNRVPMAQLRPAHYACAPASMTWCRLRRGAARGRGRRGPWSRPSIRRFAAATGFSSAEPGEAEPRTFLPVLELMYLCLSLGFQGRYRLSPRGPAELDRMREDVTASCPSAA